GEFSIDLNALWFAFWAPIHAAIVADTAADASVGVPDFEPPFDLLETLSNGAAGYGAGVSCGLTSYLRRGLGYGDEVDHNSVVYNGCQIAGSVNAAAIGMANPCAAAGLARPAIYAVNGVQACGNAIGLADNLRQGNWGSAAFNAMGLYGNMSMLRRTCFVAGTPLLTPDGSKPIEEFKLGDLILSSHEDDPTGPIEPKHVEDVFVQVSPILELRVGDQLMETTPEHPFWVEGRGWVGAGLLLEGDRLRSHNGTVIVVGSISATRKVTTVYNVAVADYHTYFVGSRYTAFSVWAHNGPPCAANAANRQLSPRAARRQAMREAGIPTSQQPVSQRSVHTPEGKPVGRQYTYETPKAGGGTQTQSV